MGLPGPDVLEPNDADGVKEVSQEEQKQLEKVEELKAAIGPLTGRAKIFCTDACLLRYLRARNWDVNKAEKMLRDTLSWRESYQPEMIRWDDVQQAKDVGRMHRTDFFDEFGRRVVVMVPARGGKNPMDHANQIKYLVHTLENAILAAKPDVEKMVWFLDFRGWSLAVSTPLRTSLETVHILQSHYPERLGLAILYNCPQLFQVAFKLISPFIDPVTRQKMNFVYSDQPKTHKVVEDIFVKELLAKLLQEDPIWGFDLETYTVMMHEDDKKADALWGVRD